MDTIDIEILEDGTIKFTTDKVSGANHLSADEFLNEVCEAAGGKRVTEHRHGSKAKAHRHRHAHAKGGAH